MSTLPNEGTRFHSAFVRVENGVPVQTDKRPLRWKTDEGQRPTDEWLAEQGYYGLISAKPQVDEGVEKAVLGDISTWIVDDVAGTVTEAWSVVPLDEGELAERQAAAALEALRAEQQAVVEAAKLDGFIQTFVGYDATQVQNYVETNVTDLASAKSVIKKLALICLALSKQTLSQ